MAGRNQGQVDDEGEIMGRKTNLFRKTVARHARIQFCITQLESGWFHNTFGTRMEGLRLFLCRDFVEN